MIYIAVKLVELLVKQDYIETKLEKMENEMKEGFANKTNNINNLHVHTCGGTRGWRCAVHLHMTDRNTDCPSGWNMTGYSKTTCGRLTDEYHSCDSVSPSLSLEDNTVRCVAGLGPTPRGTPSVFYGYNRGRQIVPILVHGS